MSPVPTPCLEPNCNGYVYKRSRCRNHQRVWVASTRKERLPADWQYRRAEVLRPITINGKLVFPLCYLCNENTATQCDHIIAGDNHSFNNLAPICDPCHRKKSAQEGAAARWGKK